MSYSEINPRKYNWSFIDILYAMSIISIFILGKIYPVIFLLFIVVSGFNIITTKRIDFKKEVWIILAMLFMGIAIITSIVNSELDVMNSIKLIVNILFLIVSYLTYKDSLDVDLKNKVIFVVKFLILINFIQIMWIYIHNGLFDNVFLNGGLENSDTRYIVSQYKAFIGAESKNIWATKLAFIQLIYLYYISEKKSFNKLNIIFIIMSISNILLLLSRTGQVAYFIGFGSFVAYKLITHNSKKVKNLSKIFGIVVLLLGIFIFVDKFLNIRFDKTDGGYIRLIYWKTFFKHIWDTNFIFGNGMLYTRSFLTDYSPYYIGESNMHNIILNTWLDFGIIGLAVYISFIGTYFYTVFNKTFNFNKIFIIIIPFIATLMLQYLGYDNDIVIFLSLVSVLSLPNEKLYT